MRRIVGAVLLALWALPAYAESPEGLKLLPKWHMSNGEACYAFEDARKLVLLDQDLYFLKTSAVPTYTEMYGTMKLSNEKFKLSLDSLTQALESSNKDRAQLYSDLEAAIKARGEAEAKAATAGQLGWIVAGGVALVAVGAGLGVYVSR